MPGNKFTLTKAWPLLEMKTYGANQEGELQSEYNHMGHLGLVLRKLMERWQNPGALQPEGGRTSKGPYKIGGELTK